MILYRLNRKLQICGLFAEQFKPAVGINSTKNILLARVHVYSITERRRP